MKKKKILFIVTHAVIFKGFFQSEIKSLSKMYDIYILVSKYGFDNIDFSKKQNIWFNDLENKNIVKKIFFLDQISYSNFYQSLTFNKKFICILRKIKSLDIDIFLFPNRTSYWEEILFEFFKKKQIFCYLTNPPSGLDLFNNFKNLSKSIKNKRIYKTFTIKSDNTKLHLLNTRQLSNSNFFYFIFQKINIFFSKLINHYFMPLLLIKKIINLNSIYYQLNLNFLSYSKIIIFNSEFKIFLKKIISYKNNKVYFCSKNFKKRKRKNYDWLFTYSSNDKKFLSKLFKYLLILKKLNKLDKIYFKGHPTWKHLSIEQNYFDLLKKNGVKFKKLDPFNSINYSNYYGLISAPSSVILEANYNCPDIKIIGIKKNKNLISGLLYKFYNNHKKITWEPSFKSLKFYLKNDYKIQTKNLNLQNLFSKF
mgnify:CR=1 FL=1|tara:strand:- start:1724 stop:2989 length:1266 start_codon:yes stop_codon:yes gene_type:complete